jgi:hypothetical protein
MEAGGKLSAAKEHGWLRSEGKEYEVKDGDICHFLFNVYKSGCPFAGPPPKIADCRSLSFG